MFDFVKKPIENVKEFSDVTGNSLKNILAGRIFTKEQFMKQYKLILLILFFMFCYTGNRYSCEAKIAQIDQLQRKLDDVKFEALTRSSELLGISKQSQVQQMLSRRDSSLFPSKTPPFRIDLD